MNARAVNDRRVLLGARFMSLALLAGAAASGAETLAIAQDEPLRVTRDVVSLFPCGLEGGREMAAVGRFLAQDPARRSLAAEVLARAAERLAESGAPDDAVEVLLGETVEALAGDASAPFPRGVRLLRRVDPASGASRWVYDGAAYGSVLARARAGPLRERAAFGLLRCRHPFPGTGLLALLVEADGFLTLAESASDLDVAAAAASRASLSALHLGRLLLAVSRAQELRALAARLDALPARLPPSVDSRRVRGRARLLAAMGGDGTLPFPQVAEWGAGPRPMGVSLEGELGDLRLVVRGAGAAPARRFAGPVLPVPGSLRLSPDGRSAAWLEVSTPSAITPMLVSLETGAGADASILAGGRPSRDRRRAHVATTLLGFSPDGSRLGLSTVAWNDEPPSGGRLSVVETASARLLLEASEGGRGRVRRELANGGAPPRRLHPRGRVTN